MADILDDPQASRFFHSVALELADKYAGLDEERTASVLARTVRDIHGRPLTKWPKARSLRGSKVKTLPLVSFSPYIGEALQYLSQEEALALFERDDLGRLGTRQLYTSYLGSRDAPLFAVKQCATQINGLLRHQQKNRGDLVETGYPRTLFKGSALLTPQLVELYPVKWPSEVREKAGEYLYAWEASWKEGGPQCDYEDAPLAPGLSIADAARLGSLRGRLYDARVEVLEALVRGLRRDDPEPLWRYTKAALMKRLSADEAYFLLGIDRSLESFEYVRPRSPLSVRGALSALLGLAGHCEKELRVGTMAKTAKALGGLISKDEPGRPCLDLGEGCVGSYYEVLGLDKQGEVDTACDMLAELEEQEKEFWGEYEERVNDALAEEFETETTVQKRAKAEYVSPFSSALETSQEKLLTAKQVALRLGKHHKTVYEYGRKGTLPCHRSGRNVGFLWSEVLEATRAEAERYVETRGKDPRQR